MAAYHGPERRSDTRLEDRMGAFIREFDQAVTRLETLQVERQIKLTEDLSTIRTIIDKHNLETNRKIEKLSKKIDDMRFKNSLITTAIASAVSIITSGAWRFWRVGE